MKSVFFHVWHAITNGIDGFVVVQFVRWMALVCGLLMVVSLAPSAPLAFVAVCMVALLYRVLRRSDLRRFDRIEVANRLCDPDPLGPWIDRHVFGQATTGETIPLPQLDEEVPHGR